jgi:Rad3-related DNA helicase
MVSREKIIEHSRKIFGENFNFRANQLETLEDILFTFFQGEKNLYLLDAPTGSGKSVIAIMFASLLNEYNLRGYILASDLSLFEQYVKSIDKVHRFGHLKGVDNYNCVVNGEKFSLGDCRLKNISYEAAEELPCFRECGYLYNRKRAIKADTTVTTYSYWLIQRNYVEGKMQDNGRGVPFPIRDFTICDEAHKVPEIVQNHFSPRVGVETVPRIEELYSFLKRKGFPVPRRTPSALKTLISKVIRENDSSALFIALKELELALGEYVKCGSQMKDKIGENFDKEAEIPKEWRIAMLQVDFLKDVHCKFEDYNHIISQVGLDFMIKNPQESGNVVFNCLEESYMMNRHFHEQSKFKLLMTATMGDPKDFMKAIGAKKCTYRRMDSQFNFEDSPIYFYPERRMSMAKREENFGWMKSKVAEILSRHPSECGIIHSGSYEIASKIFQELEPFAQSRIILYTNSHEKDQALKEFAESKNGVLIGPSLLEGLDLHEDNSRFQVFLKVPFPSLGDKFVSAKMNYQPEWYDWKTSTAILQGVGRSIRSEKDWAITYFLDGCLSDLFKRRRGSFPLEFQRRIKITKD